MTERTMKTKTISLVLLTALAAAGQPLLERPPAKEAVRVNPYQHLDLSQQERAAKAGHKLFKNECAACHGQSAEGTRIAPALVAPTLSQTLPGAIFWVLRNGSLKRGMPSFAHLPDQQRWQIVTYLKTL